MGIAGTANGMLTSGPEDGSDLALGSRNAVGKAGHFARVGQAPDGLFEFANLHALVYRSRRKSQMKKGNSAPNNNEQENTSDERSEEV